MVLLPVLGDPGSLQPLSYDRKEEDHDAPLTTVQCDSWCDSHHIYIPGGRLEEGMNKEAEKVGLLSLGESVQELHLTIHLFGQN